MMTYIFCDNKLFFFVLLENMNVEKDLASSHEINNLGPPCPRNLHSPSATSASAILKSHLFQRELRCDWYTQALFFRS